jgi:hypothetical protein
VTGWLDFVARLRDRAAPASMTVLAPGFDVAPDPPDQCEGLPSWLESWERYAERRRAG